MSYIVSKYKRISTTVFAMYLSLNHTAQALDESRLWLPNRYNQLMPKLIKTAMQAEKTDRCHWVINGKMNVRKNTEKDYYFVITCRDKEHRSYNLTYLYPVEGNKANLVAEQGQSNEEKKEAKPETGIDAEAALAMCEDNLKEETILMRKVSVRKDTIEELNTEGGGFFYIIEFDTKSRRGNTILYTAECVVEKNGDNDIDILLDKSGALVLCMEKLTENTRTMIDVTVLNEADITVKKNNNEEYLSNIAFNALNPMGNTLRYLAECRINSIGVASLAISARGK